MAKRKERLRERNCKHCNCRFTYSVGQGRDRIHCSDKCRSDYKVARRPPKSQWPTCSTDGCDRHVRSVDAKKCNPCYTLEIKRRAGKCSVHKCDNPAVRVGHGLCEKHYMRVRTTGSFDLTPRVELQLAGGYIQIKAADHPLAQGNGWVPQHRAVAYDKYGKGPHPCHWCGAVHPWSSLVVDHLNEQRSDNKPANLVVSCNTCNRMRGGMIGFIGKLLPGREADLVATFEHMRMAYQRAKADDVTNDVAA